MANTLKKQIKDFERAQHGAGNKALKRRQKTLRRVLKGVGAKKTLKALKQSHRLSALAAQAMGAHIDAEQLGRVFSYLKLRTVRDPETERVTVGWFLEWNEYDENGALVDTGRKPMIGLTAAGSDNGVTLAGFGGPEIEIVYDPGKARSIQRALEKAFLKWATG